MNKIHDLLIECGFQLVKPLNPAKKWYFIYKDRWSFTWDTTFLTLDQFHEKYPNFKKECLDSKDL